MTTKQTNLIPISSYIKDVKARWDIHQREFNLLVEDILNAGRYAQKALSNALNSKDF